MHSTDPSLSFENDPGKANVNTKNPSRDQLSRKTAPPSDQLPKRNRRRVGSAYERTAANWLRAHGCRILEQNFNCRFGEIDLIAADGRTLVFVEVKYRKNASSGLPEEALSSTKIRRICRTADYYRIRHGIPETRPCRFDVIAIQGTEIRHHKNAFDYCGF